jgi:hypothetical protein
MSIDAKNTAVLLDYPMFSKPMKAAEFMSQLA